MNFFFGNIFLNIEFKFSKCSNNNTILINALIIIKYNKIVFEGFDVIYISICFLIKTKSLRFKFYPHIKNKVAVLHRNL